MSLWSRMANELVDIVELASAPPNVLVYRFPRFQDQIKYGAQLIVREGQVAVFVNEGKLADVFAPGTYTLETRNLPVLSTLQGWKYGFSSPFRAEVYFFSTRPVLNLQWGTQQAITLELQGFGLGQIRAFGQASYRIADAQAFFREMVGTTALLVDDDLRNYLRGIIVAQFGETLTESKPTLEQLQAHLSDLGTSLMDKINEKLAPLGFQLIQFAVESLSLPPDQNNQIFEYSRLNNIDLGKLTQFEVARSIGNIAKGNADGTGGSGNLGGQVMQLGVGVAAAQQVMRALDGAFTNMPKNSAVTVAAPGTLQSGTTSFFVTPPSTNIASPPMLYHVALDGKAQGPLSVDQITGLVSTGAVMPSTLVWHPGMSAWSAAATEPGLSHLFPQQPPPLP